MVRYKTRNPRRVILGCDPSHVTLVALSLLFWSSCTGQRPAYSRGVCLCKCMPILCEVRTREFLNVAGGARASMASILDPTSKEYVQGPGRAHGGLMLAEHAPLLPHPSASSSPLFIARLPLSHPVLLLSLPPSHPPLSQSLPHSLSYLPPSKPPEARAPLFLPTQLKKLPRLLKPF